MDIEHDDFSNRQVSAGQLPDFRQVALEPVARSYVPYAVLTTAAFWLILAALSVAVRFVPFAPIDPGFWVAGLLLAVAGWFCLIAWLDARRRGWAVREHDLVYRSGIIWRKTVIIPFARIQHVETASGPVERMFGLMRVKCFTAGGMTADLSVEGLDVASARKVRQYLLEQIREDADSETGAEPGADANDETR